MKLMILSLYFHFLSRKIRGQGGSGLARESKRGVYLLHNTCGRRGTILFFLDLRNLYLCFSPFMSLSLSLSLCLCVCTSLCLFLRLCLCLFDSLCFCLCFCWTGIMSVCLCDSLRQHTFLYFYLSAAV